MKRKFFIFTAWLTAACFSLFLAGGCSLMEALTGEDAQSGENGESISRENGAEEDEGKVEESVRGNSAGNILNGGLVAKQDGQIYFGSPADGGRLYRAGFDGSGRVKLSDDVPMYINVSEQYLYYVAMGEPETIYDQATGEELTTIVYGPIVRIDLEGGGRTVISAEPAANLQLVDGRLYYQSANTDEPKIYRIEADGSGKKLLTDHRADFFNVEEGWIYYRGIEEYPQLCRADLEGGGRSVLHNGDAYFMNLLEDTLYFVGDIYETEIYLGGRSLYGVGISGGAASKVSAIEPAFLNCAHGWLYYTKAHSGEICRVRPDGSLQALLSSDSCGGLFIFDQWVYYINLDQDGSLYRMALDGSSCKKIDY